MAERRPGERGPGEGPSDRVSGALQGFTVRVLIGTALAVAAAAVAFAWCGGRVIAPAPPSVERAGQSAPGPARPREAPLPDSAPVTPAAREVERRHAAGALSEAQKRFERCPGGDVRRLAWIDAQGDIKKLVRERDDGVRMEEWFDDAGRLREALVQGRSAAGAWARRITVGEDGHESVEELAGGAVPDAPPPALDRDPAALFFAGPNCAR